MQRSKRKVEASLKSKGFQLDERKHRRFVYFSIDGIQTNIWTFTSHGAKTKSVGDSLLAKMAKQCGLKKAQFLDLVDCPLEREDYELILSGKGLISKTKLN